MVEDMICTPMKTKNHLRDHEAGSTGQIPETNCVGPKRLQSPKSHVTSHSQWQDLPDLASWEGLPPGQGLLM